MCLICVEIERGRLQALEASRNLGEMREDLDPLHVEVVEGKIQRLFWDEEEKRNKNSSLAANTLEVFVPQMQELVEFLTSPEALPDQLRVIKLFFNLDHKSREASWKDGVVQGIHAITSEQAHGMQSNPTILELVGNAKGGVDPLTAWINVHLASQEEYLLCTTPMSFEDIHEVYLRFRHAGWTPRRGLCDHREDRLYVLDFEEWAMLAPQKKD